MKVVYYACFEKSSFLLGFLMLWYKGQGLIPGMLALFFANRVTIRYLLKLQSLYSFEDFTGMVIWFDFRPDLAHDTVFIDQEGLAVDAHIFFTSVVLLFPHAIQLRNSCIGISQQRIRQPIFVGKFLMGL